MKLLAIECSTDACSVALRLGAESAFEHVVAPRQHASIVLGMVERLLAGSELSLSRLDGLAFGCGPGSFTGLRIAASVVQGLAVGADLEVARVSSLAALARHAHRETDIAEVAAAFDARMGEVYWGVYAFGQSPGAPFDPMVSKRVADCLSAPADVPVPDAPGPRWVGAGTGWGVHGAALAARLDGAPVSLYPDMHPHALDVAAIGVTGFARGEAVDAALALPVYLRDHVADRPKRMRATPFDGT